MEQSLIPLDVKNCHEVVGLSVDYSNISTTRTEGKALDSLGTSRKFKVSDILTCLRVPDLNVRNVSNLSCCHQLAIGTDAQRFDVISVLSIVLSASLRAHVDLFTAINALSSILSLHDNTKGSSLEDDLTSFSVVEVVRASVGVAVNMLDFIFSSRHGLVALNFLRHAAKLSAFT